MTATTAPSDSSSSSNPTSTRPAIIEVLVSISLGLAFFFFILVSIVFRSFKRYQNLRSRSIRFEPNHLLKKSEHDERRKVLVRSIRRSEHIIENPPQYGRRLPLVLGCDAKGECSAMLKQLREVLTDIVNETAMGASSASASSAAQQQGGYPQGDINNATGTAAAMVGSDFAPFVYRRRPLIPTMRIALAQIESLAAAGHVVGGISSLATYTPTVEQQFHPPSLSAGGGGGAAFGRLATGTSTSGGGYGPRRGRRRMMRDADDDDGEEYPNTNGDASSTGDDEDDDYGDGSAANPSASYASSALRRLHRIRYDARDAADFLHTYEAIVYGPPPEAGAAEYVSDDDLTRMRRFYSKLMGGLKG